MKLLQCHIKTCFDIVQLRLLLFPVTKVPPLKNKIEKENYLKNTSVQNQC